jgi:membrane protein DedA with SNARE-associated domain
MGGPGLEAIVGLVVLVGLVAGCVVAYFWGPWFGEEGR